MKTKNTDPKAPRNSIVVAMNKRNKGGFMKDRREPRKGARNKQRDYREGNY